MNSLPVTDQRTPLNPQIAQLRREHQELEQMLRRALEKSSDELNRQHLQLSRQHNNRLLDYRLALMDACEKLSISANGLQIQYDPISQLFEVCSPRHPADRYPLERALNRQQLPQLAESTRAFLEVTRALDRIERNEAVVQQAAQAETSHEVPSVQVA